MLNKDQVPDWLFIITLYVRYLDNLAYLNTFFNIYGITNAANHVELAKRYSLKWYPISAS